MASLIGNIQDSIAQTLQASQANLISTGQQAASGLVHTAAGAAANAVGNVITGGAAPAAAAAANQRDPQTTAQASASPMSPVDSTSAVTVAAKRTLFFGIPATTVYIAGGVVLALVLGAVLLKRKG